MTPGNLDQQRNGLFRAPFADGSDGLHLYLRIAVRTLGRCTEKLETALAGTLTEQPNRLSTNFNRVITLGYLKQLIFDSCALDLGQRLQYGAPDVGNLFRIKQPQ